MKLLEPYKLYICKNKPFAFFELQGKKYLNFNGVQITELNKHGIEENYSLLTGEEVIPFILVHNWRISNIINSLRNGGRGGKHHLFIIVKNAYIENELNTNLSVDDIYREYDNGIITYDELHIALINYYQNKYRME